MNARTVSAVRLVPCSDISGYCREDKKTVPDKQKIRSLIQSRCWTEAKRLCAVLCRHAANDAEAWHLQGIILGQLEAHAESEQSFRKAAAQIVMNHLFITIWALHCKNKGSLARRPAVFVQ